MTLSQGPSKPIRKHRCLHSLCFITVSKLQFRSSNENSFTVGHHHNMRKCTEGSAALGRPRTTALLECNTIRSHEGADFSGMLCSIHPVEEDRSQKLKDPECRL